MEQVMTVEEVHDQFDSEWILLADPEVDEFGRVLGGKVVAHSKDRDEVYRKDIELKLKSSATFYTGKISSDTIIIL
ncbi:MAG: hypothetical protein ACOYON_10390 [Fimbriimonas sp.]